MAKQPGLGDNFYVSGYDLSGTVNAVNNVGGGPATIDVTDITQSGVARIGGKRDGRMAWTSLWDPAVSHPVLSALPTTDVTASYLRGTGIGSPVANIVGKQIDYAPTRAADGTLTLAVEVDGNGFGLEWGTQLTNGKRVDTAATLGASWDRTTVTSSFGAQAYLHVLAFTGTDFTVKIQDSADNGTFADVAGLAFTQVLAAGFTPQVQRIATSNVATIRRYLRAVTVTTGGITSATFAVSVVVNDTAVTF